MFIIFQLIKIIPVLVGFALTFSILGKMKLYFRKGGLLTSREGTADKAHILLEIAGISLFPIILVIICFSIGLPFWMERFGFFTYEMKIPGIRNLQLIAGCAILFIVGFKTDVHGTGIKAKFLALLASSSLFPLSGLWIRDVQGLFGFYEISPVVGIPLTLMFVTFITETVVLLDDIDGLGLGITSILSTLFLAFSFVYNFDLGITMSSAALGVSLPFSCLKMFSKDWKKTLVGHAGSYVVGYLIAGTALSIIQQSHHTMPFGMLMIVFGILLVPSFDVLRALRDRVKEGRSMVVPDRNQMQHRLIRLGIPAEITPFCIIAVILFFTAFNTYWALNIYKMNALLLIDLAVWFLLVYLNKFFIEKREQKMHFKQWNMEYGREAWEANVPVEIMERKHMEFGSLNLPKEVILGDEVEFIPDGMSAFERIVKRLSDLLISSVLLVFFSPLFLLSYLLIKFSDGGPAIYSQERIGRFGRPFMIYKYRSMRVDAEKFGPALSHSGGEDDPRLTKVGKFLRAHHLDELPQLWNVFCGDMSFIGYRPERAFFIEQIMEHDPRYSFLYQIRPGVTSYATLYNGYTDTMEKMLRRLNYDLFYLEHRSFWFDMRILWLTFINIVFGKKF